MGTVGIIERGRKEKEMGRERKGVLQRKKTDRDRDKKKVTQVGEMGTWLGEIKTD